jgi:hypothetical protein
MVSAGSKSSNHLPELEVKALASNAENSDKVTVVLGDEYDEGLRAKLIDVFRELCAVQVSSSGKIVVGSQEIEKLEIIIDGHKLFVESETYIGLSISGPKDIVQRIQGLLSVGTGGAP